MSDWKLPWDASCLCGRVKMCISAAPAISMACHCTGCQKLTGGAYSLTLMLPVSGFSVEGDTQIGALHRDEGQHHYCSHCLSWLYTTNPNHHGDGLSQIPAHHVGRRKLGRAVHRVSDRGKAPRRHNWRQAQL